MASLGFLRPEGRPFYGIDAPRELAFLCCLASACFIVVCVLSILPRRHEKLQKTLTESRRYNKLYFDLLRPLFIVGLLYFGGCCAHYVYSSLELKYSVAERMVSMANWSQTRSVLDVGCGRGLLMNTFALALKNEGIDGHVTGVDVWDAKDQSQSSAVAALDNARKEGVREYVEVRTADARELPFPDASFDLVVSSMCIHNIEEGSGRYKPKAYGERRKALDEMLRVLKPGGQLIIWDGYHAREYHKYLRIKLSPLRNGAQVWISEDLWAYAVKTQIVSALKHRDDGQSLIT
ncbi:hypothetical protein KFL_000200370 [Klebsormidium nitens]|uniref:Methyltransferase type 11 domain-containing protein n=1 Tax=Klebsormidium nitens TaxID=105231 RepID=A0A1Y1HJZ9_KLENI|nr:hypothetical protein KFL_000200370 [Klebsormidium nitens]|eukprot:GAQ78885.1 hypothetical protein KFL_000200370 [Klebsormidium nitens]